MKKNLFRNLVIAVFTILSFVSIAQPVNDLCAGATPLTLGNPCVNGTVVGANDNITSTAGCQAGGGVNQHLDVWYSFVATGSQFDATFTSSAPFTGNIEFLLVTGACGAQSIVSSSCAASPMTVTVPGLTIGTTYYVIVSKQGSGTAGPFTICNYNTTTSACTANDDCFTAQNITLNAVGAASVCTPGCNTGAAPGLDFVGNNCEDMLNPTVWYTFTTGATAASININLTSATMTNPEYTIYSNTSLCFGPYNILNCLEGTGGSATTTSLVVAPNTTYYIAVSDATGDQGNFNLCIAQNADNSACNTNNNLVVSATSMGSPLTGPYKPGEVVSFCYTITDWQQINCNYIGAVVPSFGDCWAASSFNAQGMPVNITTPLNVNGVIQPCPPGPPCSWSTCVGTPAGTWNWFPAGAAQYNVAGGSLPVGAAMGAGWYFLSSYDPFTEACTGDPTDPDFTYGDGNFPACGTNTFDYTLCFNLTAGPAGNCGTGLTDCGVSFKTYADGEFGAWNSIGCTADISTVSSATFACCAPPNMTSSNTYTLCSGSAVSLPLTSDIAATYSWIATNNTNVTGESTTAQTTNTLNNTLTNTTSSVQVVVYTITPTSTTSCLGVAQTVTVTVYPKPTTTASTTGTLTCTTTTVSLSSTLAGTSYTWTAPAGGSVGSANTQSTSASGAAGTYTLLVQSAAGCTFSTTTVVTQNITPPTPTASNSTTLSCTITTAVLTGAGGGTYVWSGPGITAGGSTSTPTVNAPGNYTVTVTAANGCTAAATTSLTQNIVIPSVTASANQTLTCTTPTVTLTGSATPSTCTPIWTGGVITGSTTYTATATAANVYTLTVTDPASGCTNFATTQIFPSAGAPTATITSSALTIDCNNATQSVTVTSTPNTDVTYTWNTPPSTVSANGDIATFNSSNTYICTVTNTLSNCSTPVQVVITTNTVAPTGLSAGSNQTLSCSAASVTLNGSVSSPTNVVLNWGASVCGTQTTAVTSACAAGVYTLTATNPANGCVATSTVEVFPNAGAPAVTITSTALVIDCNNATQSVTVTSTPSADVVYNWNNTPSSASVDSSIAVFNNAGTYICSVTNTLSNCSTPVQVVVTTNTTAPIGVSAGSNQTLTCASTSVALNGSVTTPTNVLLDWGTSVCGTQTTAVTAACVAGVYTLTATDPANGCVATSSVEVFPNAGAPTATISSTALVIDCNNASQSVTVTSTPNTNVTYTWNIAPATLSTDGSIVSFTSPNTYICAVTNTLSNCSTPVQVVVTTNTTVPTAVTTDTTIPCGASSIILDAVSSATNVSYNWTTSGAGIISTPTASSTSVNSAGQYEVTVTDNTNGCSTTSTVNVTSISVTAAFTANPTSGTAPLLVNFTNQTPGVGNVYSWNFADDNNNTSSATNPSHTYNTTGNYIVTLVVTDASGLCSATATISIDVFENASIVVPNVFTPNGDGKNDIFKITTTGMKDLNCDIFNRWGTKVFTIDGVNGFWDGINSNDGTYFFILTATGFDGAEYKQQGYINLFK